MAGRSEEEVECASPPQLRDYVSLPKVELHAHLGGSARRTTVEELLRRQGREDASALASSITMVRDEDGIPVGDARDSFAIIWEAHQDDPQLVRRMVREYLEDCLADGIVYVELRTGGGDRAKLEAVLDALNQAQGELDIIARLIVSLKRDGDPRAAQAVVDSAIALRSRGIVAIDFCGAEQTTAQFTAEFEDAVRRARDAGIPFVPHFAECPGEQDLNCILGSEPSRLGHALWMPPAVERRVLECRIPIECCLVSNFNTMRNCGVWPEGSEPPASKHPIMSWFASGHPFALCCDNVSIHGVPLSEHYKLAAEAVSASSTDIRRNAWYLAYNATNLILAGEDVKLTLQSRLLAHPWCPLPSSK